MREEKKNEHSIEEEMEWRIQVLKRTARTCAAEAKRLGREKDAMARMDPLGDRKGLEKVLRSIDELMEWRFVDALGRVELDSDMLTQNITVGKLRIIRACVVRAIEATEGGAR